MHSSTLVALLGLLALAAAQAPNALSPNVAVRPSKLGGPELGTYKGSKSILGQKVEVTMDIDSTSEADFAVAGPISINCKNEEYVYESSSGLISFTKVNTAGDCMHDALSSNGASLQSVKYDGQITIKLKVTFLSVSIVLTHQGEENLQRDTEVVAPWSPSLAELASTRFNELMLRNPAGTYTATKKVLGVTSKAVIRVAATHFSLALTGFKNVDCSDEAYTYSNEVITVTNINKQGDCLHDNMEEDGVALKSIAYEPAPDTITVDIKAGPISLTIVLDHTSESSAVVDFDKAVDNYFSFVNLSDGPSGSYSGSKTVLGQKVTVKVKTDTSLAESTGYFDLAITGIAPITCNHEPYSYSNGVLTPTDIGHSGDCLHDQFQQNHITLNYIKYSQSSDKIDINVKYTFVTLDFELTHDGLSHVTVEAPASQYTVPELFDNFFKSSLQRHPTGLYQGAMTVFDHKIASSVVFKSSSQVDFEVSGLVGLSCSAEAYQYRNGVVTFTDASNCLKMGLNSNAVTLESITYDTVTDEVRVNLRKSFFPISLNLQHQ